MSLTGCKKSEDNESTTTDSASETGSSFADAEISIPAGLVGDEVSDKQAAYTEDDGSFVVYALSGDERDDIVRRLSDELADSIDVIVDGEVWTSLSTDGKVPYTGNDMNVALVVSSVAVIALAVVVATVATKKRLAANA